MSVIVVRSVTPSSIELQGGAVTSCVQCLQLHRVIEKLISFIQESDTNTTALGYLYFHSPAPVSITFVESGWGLDQLGLWEG